LRRDQQGKHRGARGQFARHAPHRNPVRTLRLTSRPRLPRRPETNGPAFLHQRRFTEAREEAVTHSKLSSRKRLFPTRERRWKSQLSGTQETGLRVTTWSPGSRLATLGRDDTHFVASPKYRPGVVPNVSLNAATKALTLRYPASRATCL